MSISEAAWNANQAKEHFSRAPVADAAEQWEALNPARFNELVTELNGLLGTMMNAADASVEINHQVKSHLAEGGKALLAIRGTQDREGVDSMTNLEGDLIDIAHYRGIWAKGMISHLGSMRRGLAFLSEHLGDYEKVYRSEPMLNDAQGDIAKHQQLLQMTSEYAANLGGNS